MRAVIQRVSQAGVTIDGTLKSETGPGMMILLGVTHDDTRADIEWLAAKIAALRIFDDEQGVMNLNICQSGGEIMVISQFTLYASTKKGNRPSYIAAAGPELANRLYDDFVEQLGSVTGKEIRTGVFGADMKVTLVNDGPVTICIDSKKKE